MLSAGGKKDHALLLIVSMSHGISCMSQPMMQDESAVLYGGSADSY